MQDNIFNFCEKKLPQYTVIITLITCSIIRFNLAWFDSYKELLTNTTTVISILISILMSMMGFLLTVSGRNVIKKIVNMGVHRMILSYFIKPITCGLLIVINSIVIKGMFDFTKSSPSQYINCILSCTLIVLCSYFLSAFIRIISLMYLILLSVFNEISIESSRNENKIEENNNENIKDEEFDFDNPDEHL